MSTEPGVYSRLTEVDGSSGEKLNACCDSSCVYVSEQLWSFGMCCIPGCGCSTMQDSLGYLGFITAAHQSSEVHAIGSGKLRRAFHS